MLAALADGDPTAVAHMCDALGPALFNVAMFGLADRDAAQDAVVTLLVRLSAAPEAWLGRTPLRTQLAVELLHDAGTGPRQCLSLALFAGLDYRAIAAALGIPAEQVLARLREGLRSFSSGPGAHSVTPIPTRTDAGP